ncbi:hypothetical protein OS493_015829 [Desmophyllum pertusum]|uniref:Mutator-like transposase domain-containing protein n=1 Tax=Desmophyllum pertusum TaxID=174260 RepID=A0A9W9YFT3_9CNID|nr:hypothetical protein OS493_015829 [Desmophyllum pertusum]
MASFLAGNFARHKSGRFVKSSVVIRSEHLHEGNKKKLSESESIGSATPSVLSCEFPVTGRCIVELKLLAKELDGCNLCGKTAQFIQLHGRNYLGLGSFLYITCREESCGEINVCHTSKVHRANGARGRPVFDINTKLAAGAELAQECANKFNAEVQILVGDDDSATVKKVRESVSHNVEKWSDINHAKKSFTSHLYALQSQFKR